MRVIPHPPENKTNTEQETNTKKRKTKTKHKKIIIKYAKFKVCNLFIYFEGSSTVPEGQSVGNFEPTPRTYYLIPRGEKGIFGELSGSWLL